MSDYHIRTMAEDKKTIRVIFHIPVPEVGTNEAGIQWRDAIVDEQGGSDEIISKLPGISVAEETDLKAGALVEVSENFRFTSTSLTTAERKAQVEARYDDAKAETLTEKINTLTFMGYEGDV